MSLTLLASWESVAEYETQRGSFRHALTIAQSFCRRYDEWRPGVPHLWNDSIDQRHFGTGSVVSPQGRTRRDEEEGVVVRFTLRRDKYPSAFRTVHRTAFSF